MKKASWKVLMVFMSLLMLSSIDAFARGNRPRLDKLRKTGFIIGPGDNSYKVHKSWKELTKLMADDMDVFDNVVNEIESVVCGDQQNKSVLLVGEPTDTVKYIIGRLASKKAYEKCPEKLWHVEIDTNAIVADHMYVGQVEGHYREYISEPSKNKDVVLYFTDLEPVVGMGSSSNHHTGIETNLMQDIRLGALRVVAFLNKNAYRHIKSGKFAHVVYGFGREIRLDDLKLKQIDKLVNKFIALNAPQMIWTDEVSEHFTKTLNHYSPSGYEPQRSINAINAIIRSQWYYKTHFVNYDTGNPYAANAKKDYLIAFSEYDEVQLFFKRFDTEKSKDELFVLDGSGKVLDVFSGTLGHFKTRFYKTNKLKLKFTANGTVEKTGFRIDRIIGRKKNNKAKSYAITKDDVRRIIMQTVGVPDWLINKNFNIVKNLRNKLDEVVVGVEEGKRDLVRLSRIGYVAGRTAEKPVATVMFVGSTGTGKSYIAKQVARAMNMKLITLDMTSYQTPYDLDRFLEVMSKNLTINPYAFYLFEEIDKAAKNVLDQLYFMLDEGVFYDKHQKKIFARGAFMIFTTNAGEDIVVKEQDNPRLREMVMRALQQVYRMSFLNRFDAITIFYPFSNSEFLDLARIMVKFKKQYLTVDYGWKLAVDEGTIRYMAKHGRSKLYGARPMERLVENIISIGIAEYQIFERPILEGETIKITKDNTSKNTFKITVSGDTSTALTYEIDPKNNSGRSNGTDDRSNSKDDFEMFEAINDRLNFNLYNLFPVSQSIF